MIILVRVFSTVGVLSADGKETATITGDSRPKSGVRRNGRTVAVKRWSI